MSIDRLNLDYGTPPFAARYRAVFWEPVLGTGERIVALISLESAPFSEQALPANSHVVISLDRLRAMLGRQRGTASFGVLNEVAEFLTFNQSAGLSLDNMELPFQGVTFGPVMSARGYSLKQLIDSAVRSVSAFGSADDIFPDDANNVSRNTVKTKQFLQSLRRHVAGDDKQLKGRFDRRFQPKQGLPDVTVDYAFNQWMVQVTSLPLTSRQAAHSLREAQSKLYELDLIRRGMGENPISPILMVNEDALSSASTSSQKDQAMQMLERLRQLAVTDELELVQTPSAEDGARVLLDLV